MPEPCGCNPSEWLVCGYHMSVEGLIRLCEAVFQGAPIERTRRLPRDAGGRPDNYSLDFIARKLA